MIIFHLSPWRCVLAGFLCDSYYSMRIEQCLNLFGYYMVEFLVTHSLFVYICRGILIKTLANASRDGQSMSLGQIVFNVAGFCLTVATTIVITLYAKRRLKELQIQEEQLLLQWSYNHFQLHQALNGNGIYATTPEIIYMIL